MALDDLDALRAFITDMSKYDSSKSEHELKFDYITKHNTEYTNIQYDPGAEYEPGFKIKEKETSSGGSATTTTTTIQSITYNKSQKKKNKKRYNKQRTKTVKNKTR